MGRTPVLSPIRQEIFNFIVAHKSEHDGNSPSIREIAQRFHRSTNTVSYDLDYMALIGLIELPQDGRSRMIRVVGARWSPPEPAEKLTAEGSFE